MQRVREGWAEYKNPFGPQMYRVSLAAENVRAIVFWTRNPSPLWRHLDELDRDGHRYYFHFTITGLPPELEPCSPPKDLALAEFRRLSKRLGAKRVLWRFDPLLESGLSPLGEQRRWFERLAAELEGYTERCYTSFAHFYGKAARRLTHAGIAWRDPDPEEKIAFIHELAEIAAGCGITVYACCNDILVGGLVQKAHCVDAALIEDLWPLPQSPHRIKPTRRECGCCASRDIGAYDTCGHGCLYCYAASARSSPACDPDAGRLMRTEP